MPTSEGSNLFRLAMEAAPSGMVMLASNGTIILANAQIEQIFGYTRRELLGKPVEMLMPERFRERHPHFREAFFRNPQPRPMARGMELFGQRKDGTEIPVEISLTPVETPSGAFALAAIADITERKRSERDREDLLGQLRTLNSDLETRVADRTRELSATLKEREVLLQEIHHRVKNNLQVISSLINLQRRQVVDPQSRDALEECQTRVQAIALIHEKLYQSKDYSRVPFSEYAKSLVRSVLAANRTSASHVGLDLEVHGLSLTVDRAIPCGLILNELVTNALKHAFPNGRRGTIRVELGQVDETDLVLAVSDDGVGLPATIDSNDSLGMQLVRTLVAQLDGRLDVLREPETSFRVIFPANPS